MKNFLLKQLVRWGRPKPHPVTGRVLVVTTTALGDTLWATPAIKALRPHCSHLAVLTSPLGSGVLKHNPAIDQVHVLGASLYKERFDTVLVFHTSQRIVLPLICMIGASRIVGTVGINKGLDSLLTVPLQPAYEHEIVRRLRIAEVIGVPIPRDQTLEFFLTDEERLPQREGGPWIAIHPGSQDRFKRWPTENFIAVGKRLKEQIPGCEILVTGGARERPLMEEVARQIPGAHLDPERSLRSFAALLEQMNLLISNDTGPTHLAWALKRPAISLFSPTDPRLCGPHQAAHAAAIAYPPTCSPCLKRACRSPFCMLQIGVDEVVATAQKLLYAAAW